LQRQVTRVSRRLFLQTVLDSLMWCWTGAFVVAGVWFLVQSAGVVTAEPWVRWAVAGGAVGLATVLAGVLALLRAPSKVAAALALDEKFGLKERVTTSLTLAPNLEQTPAGQALLEDATQRVRDLDVRSRFPVTLSWTAVAPVAAGFLAALALLYQPTPSQATLGTKEELAKPVTNPTELAQKMNELKKRAAEKREAGKHKSEELERLEAELEKIANKPRETKEQLRERIKEMTALEEQMKNREKELAEKSKSLKSQLQQMDKLSEKGMKDGPAKDLDKALSEGKLDKAKEEIERLIKKLENNELSQKQKEQLQKQLEEMQKKLERAADLKDKEEKLKQANLDPETLKREMARLQEEKKKLKDLKDLAEKLGKCQQCLKEGNLDDAKDAMKAAGKKMGEMDLDDQDLESLRDQLKRLQDAGECACKSMKGDPQANDTDQPNEGGIGAGRRPLGEKGPYKSFDAKARVDFDPKGKKIFDGYAPGQNFKKKSGPEMAGEINQAAQEAPEAVEQQRIPRAYRDSAKGFYRKLREQTEVPAKPQPQKEDEEKP
jgi:hypothetical protein